MKVFVLTYESQESTFIIGVYKSIVTAQKCKDKYYGNSFCAEIHEIDLNEEQ